MADFVLRSIYDNSDLTKGVSEDIKSFNAVAEASKKAGDTTKKAFKDAADGAKDANEAIKNIPKATEKITNEFAKLKREIKDYKAQALAAGETSPIGLEFLKKAAEATDRLGDLNGAVKKLSSDTSSLDALTGAARGIAAGFSIAQGAAAVFGDESKDLQKDLLKVQGAMALLNGLTEIQNLLQKESAVRLAITSGVQKASAAVTAAYGTVVSVVTGQISLATVATNIWSAATKIALGPIGLLIGAVGAIGGAILLFRNNTEDSVESLEKLNKSTETYYKFKIRIAEIQGKEDEVFQLRKKQAEANFANLEKERKLIETAAKERGQFLKDDIKRLEEINIAQRDLANESSLIEAERNAKIQKSKEEFNKKVDAVSKKLRDEEIKNQKALNDLIADLNRIAADQLAKTDLDKALLAENEKFDALKKRAEGHTKELVKIEELRQNALSKVRADADKKAQDELDVVVADIEKTNKEKKEKDIKDQEDLSLVMEAIEAENVRINKEAEEKKAEIRAAGLQNTIEVFGQLAQLAGQNAEAQAAFLEFQKLASIVQVVIATQKQLAEIGALFPGPLGFVFEAIAIAKGAAQVATIASQQPPKPPKVPGFRKGGFTGHGYEWEEAGVTHKQEFVSDADTTRRHRPLLEAMHTEDYSKLKLIDLAPLLQGTGISLAPDVAKNALQNHSISKEIDRQTSDESAKRLASIEKKMERHFNSQTGKPTRETLPDGTQIIKQGNKTRIIRKKP